MPHENHIVYLDAQKNLAVEIAVIQSTTVSSGSHCSVECVLQFCKLYIRQGYVKSKLNNSTHNFAVDICLQHWRNLTRTLKTQLHSCGSL